MERAEFLAVVGPLALALRADLDAPTWTAYYRALNDVPVVWLQAAADAALRQDRAFMPKPGELRALATAALTEAQGKLSPSDCGDCGNTRWVETPDTRGVLRAARCGCWHAFKDAIAALGSVEPPQKLLTEREAFDARMAQVGSE